MPEPTQEDAKLLLQLYDLRREKVLRRARDFVQKDCKFKDHKDFNKRYPVGTKEQRYVSMTLGYWDLACTLVVKGLVNEDLFNSTNFEHVNIWYKFRSLVDNWRKELQYPIMQAMETVASRHPAAAAFQQSLAKPADKKGKKKKKGKKEKGEKAKAAAAGDGHAHHDGDDEDDD